MMPRAFWTVTERLTLHRSLGFSICIAIEQWFMLASRDKTRGLPSTVGCISNWAESF